MTGHKPPYPSPAPPMPPPAPKVFRWMSNHQGGFVLLLPDDRGIGRVTHFPPGSPIEAQVYLPYPSDFIADLKPISGSVFWTTKEAQQRVEQFWRDAAATAREIGL